MRCVYFNCVLVYLDSHAVLLFFLHVSLGPVVQSPISANRGLTP